MKNKKRILSLIITVLLVVGLLSGCSDTGSGNNGNSSSEGASKNDGDKVIMKLGLSGDIASFDPHAANDLGTTQVTTHLYNRLIALNSNNEFVGDLAESWNYVDDKTVEFKLKPDVKFHNGEVLTSEDVKFSLEREKTSSRVGHLVTIIDNVEVVDDLTFIIHLNEPSSALISSLSHVGSSILNKKHVEELEAAGKKIDENPIGTGPYKYESFKSGDSTLLLKNDDYFGEKAKNDGLMYKIIPEGSSRTIALETGEIDVLVNVETVDANKIRDNKNLKMEEYESTAIEFLMMNTKKAPFDNPKVRQAINYAVDKVSIIKVYANNEATPVDSYLASGAIGYSPDVVKYEYNLEKAKQLLTEAGYPDGFETTACMFGEGRSRAAQVLQAALAEIGVKLNIEMMEKGAFYDITGQGNYEICLTGWNANAEPDNTFAPLFLSTSSGSTGNRCFYNNPEVDKLILGARVETDLDKRLEMYAQAQKIMTEDAIIAPFFTLKGLVGVRANVEGLVVSSIGYHMYTELHYVK